MDGKDIVMPKALEGEHKSGRTEIAAAAWLKGDLPRSAASITG